MKKGFTLLELLVVIAILGILSAVVIVSLSSAKSKGDDSATKAQMSKTRDIAELFLQSVAGAGAYTGFCTSPSYGIQAAGIHTALIKSSRSASYVSTFATAGTATTVVCHETSSAWALSAPLRSETGYWCVDSAGFAGKRTSVLGASVANCPAS